MELKELLKPPVVCHSPDRAAYDRTLYVCYGLLFQARERSRDRPPWALESLHESKHNSCRSSSLEFRSSSSSQTPDRLSEYKVETLFTGYRVLIWVPGIGAFPLGGAAPAAPRSASKRKQALGLTNRLKALPSPLTSQLPINLAFHNASPQAPLHAQRTVNVVILLSVLSLGLVSFLSMVFDLPFQTGFSKCY